MAKTKAKNKDTKKKNIKEIEIEEIEEFDDEEFDFVDEDEEVVVTKKTAIEAELDDEDFEPLTLEERVISIEKKLNITLVFIIIAALFSLLAFVANLSGGTAIYSDEHVDEGETSTESPSYDTSAFTKVKVQDLEKLSKGKKIIVWIGRQGCGYCANYVPTITQIGEDFGETIYYLDLADMFDFSTETVSLLDEEAYNIMMDFATDEENEDVMEEFGATPMTLIIKNNKIVGSFTGALDADTVTSTLKAEGFKLAK